VVACPTEPWIRGLWAVAGMDSDDLAPEHLLAASRTSPRGRGLNNLITLACSHEFVLSMLARVCKILYFCTTMYSTLYSVLLNVFHRAVVLAIPDFLVIIIAAIIA